MKSTKRDESRDAEPSKPKRKQRPVEDEDVMGGFYTEEDDADDAYARILITGPPKVGKTVAVVTTSPQPVVVLNCDGKGALAPARRFGGKFFARDITCAKDWDNATREIVKLARTGDVRTCVVDTLTALVNNTIAREMKREYDGFEIWRQTQDCVMTGIDRLRSADCHLIVIAHIMKDEAAGVLPDIPGSLARLTPALLHDWVNLVHDTKADERVFVVGPQENWPRSGRHIKRSLVMPADVEELLAEFKIAI